MSAAELYAYAEEVVRLVNIERAKEGLRELALKPEMMEVARIKSQDMIDYDYFGHSPAEGRHARVNGSTGMLVQNLNIRGLQGRAEAIAIGRTPIEVVSGWLESPGHRKILLSDWTTHIGVGVACKIDGLYKALYWTLIVNTWTNLDVDGDSRESVQNQPKPVATDPATAYTPLKVS
jgi:uncharacterized protein YkwD